MFPKKPVDTASLEHARREAIRVLLETPVEDENYKRYLKNVERLSALIVKESPDPLNWNAVLPVVGTIASVVMIVGHEKAHVLTSKALQFLPKLLK